MRAARDLTRTYVRLSQAPATIVAGATQYWGNYHRFCPRNGATITENSMKVKVEYAQERQMSGQNLLPYDDLEFQIIGDHITVADWVDEHVIAGKAAMDGLPYTQWAWVPAIIKALLNDDTLDLGYGLLKITRLEDEVTATRLEDEPPVSTPETGIAARRDGDTAPCPAAPVPVQATYTVAFDDGHRAVFSISPSGMAMPAIGDGLHCPLAHWAAAFKLLPSALLPPVGTSCTVRVSPDRYPTCVEIMANGELKTTWEDDE